MSGVGAWIRYGHPISQEQLDFAARHYRAAILQPWEQDSAAWLKHERPDMTVLCYKCLSSSRDYEPGPVFSSGVSHAEAADAWFARRLNGQRISWQRYPGHWQMAVWHPGYRRRWVDNVVDELSDSPFDGVMADNDVFDDYYGLDLPLEGLGSLSELRAALDALVAAAGRGLNDVGKILVPNIAESRREPGRWARHSAWGGGFEEVWLGYRPAPLFDAPTALAQVEQLNHPGITIVRVPTDGSDEHPNFRYGLAAFWVFGGGRGAISATGHDAYNGTPFIPELDWDLGAPVEEPRWHEPDTWTRRFESGWAAVNLAEGARRGRQLFVPRGLVDAEGVPAGRHVVLPPHRGMVLRHP